MEQRADWLPPTSPTPASTPAPPATPAVWETPPPHDPQPQQEPPRGRSRLRRLFGPLIVGGALVLRLLGPLKGLLLALPKLKLLSTSGSMLVSVAAYSLIWGWQFALGFVLLLLVHEMGHVIQLRREGIPASAPMFIPFLGAVVAAKSLGDNAAAEARVGLAGPILGSLGAALLVPVWLATGNEFWQALAFTGFFLNLFNLLPVVPLDGGRAMAAMSPWMWFVGLFAIVGVAFAFPNPIIILIALLAAYETWRRWKALREGGERAAAYYRVTRGQRIAVVVVYIGLIVALAVGMDLTHLERALSDA
ncbi:site-2 protease family protein [Conexibacter woesei]|uniref:Peptidase M50 n=1 Tax=Conexibacter woesei (strain DSM 14684 / CCUG 47730 / CIP 108061 / JCM 11494 / NBRC 100937 / ID131577) TaxID=469383 RepID=D3F8Z7_CONWI|nr:site-2 protease family protein [Conexibacter woesei]ADB52992.1 peptidase M50 [Conexibacter woesei DSM 14684]